MRKILLAGVLLAALSGTGAPAVAADGCPSLLMPVVELKQVARGFGPLRYGFHSGLDLTAPYGSPVRAAGGGTVVFAGRYFGYGNMIDVQVAPGMVTRYAHLSRYARGLAVGHSVASGEVIGAIGASGHAHGPHLHFEVRLSGTAVDPKPYLALAACPVGPSIPLEEARAPDPHAKPAAR